MLGSVRLLDTPHLSSKPAPEPQLPRHGRSSPLGLAGALEIGPSSPARLRWGARDGRSSPLEPARLRWGARDGRSSPLGLAGALEMAARACSVSLGRSRWPLEPARPRWGARHGRSSPLGLWSQCSERLALFVFARGARIGRSAPLSLARVLDLAARARSASLGRSTGECRTKTNRTEQTKLIQRRFAGQGHKSLLHSTQRRTYSVH